MAHNRTEEYYQSVIRELCKLPKETEWVEFKTNKAEPEEIGEYISALANAAALLGKVVVYLIWGIDDQTHAVVGTNFSPKNLNVGKEELENWLLRLLNPKINFQFYEILIEGRRVTLLEIERAFRHPVRFKGNEFIRIGSYKKRLKEYPERERQLWRIFDETPFEKGVADAKVSGENVLKLLDYPNYFELLGRPLPEGRSGVLEALKDDGLIHSDDAASWSITNMGAVLFARRLSDFGSLSRKAVRVIHYRGDSRIDTVREQEGGKGYASGFEGLIGFINGLLPSNEVIGQALRKTVPVYPDLAVRELTANALIHQDFFMTGTGPMIEIFESRMEISNPGEPIVDIIRFLDTPPKSRNESLASLMRRFGICEERGSGIDKVVSETEFYQLPAPAFEVTGGTTRAVLFAPQPLTKMDRNDRIRACYLHACLKHVNRDFMTNTSLRDRFGIEAKNSATASRMIREAVDADFIKAYDDSAAKKMMKYVPFWA